MKFCLSRAAFCAASSSCFFILAGLGCGSEQPSKETADAAVSSTPSAHDSSSASSNPASSIANSTVSSTTSDVSTVPAGDAAPTPDSTRDADVPGSDAVTDAGTKVTGTTRVGTRCAREERLGSLALSVGKDRTIVSGAISNGVLPSSVPQVRGQSGGCQLLVPRDLFCEDCNSDEACAGDNMCVSKPLKVSAGVVEVSGLAQAVEVSPNGITADYSKTILDPFPAYEVGAAIEISAQGDQVESFEAELTGVPPLHSELQAIAVSRGEGATIEWDVADVDPEQSAMFITFSVNVHGAVTGWIECIAADTGKFEVPEELVSELIDLGLSGFPRADLERRSSATVELTGGCVDVLVASKVTLDIQVEGLQSCNANSECDEGQICNEELACE